MSRYVRPRRPVRRWLVGLALASFWYVAVAGFASPAAAQNSVQGSWKLQPQGFGNKGTVDARTDASGPNPSGTMTWLQDTSAVCAWRGTRPAENGHTVRA